MKGIKMCVEWYDVVVEVENRQKENVTFIVVMKMMMMAFSFFFLWWIRRLVH